jgi:ankyrin repeat protein
LTKWILLSLPLDTENVGTRRSSTQKLLAAAAGNSFARAVAALNSGADPNARDEFGERPLTILAEQPRAQRLIRYLLECGANPQLANRYGQTPLMVACARGLMLNVRTLSPATKIDQIDRRGETALTYAIVCNRPKVVAYLLEEGASADCPPPPRWSPLMYAAFHGRQGVSRLLLYCGANPLRVDGFSQTAAQIAQSRSHGKLARQLANRGARLVSARASPSAFRKAYRS